MEWDISTGARLQEHEHKGSSYRGEVTEQSQSLLITSGFDFFLDSRKMFRKQNVHPLTGFQE